MSTEAEAALLARCRRGQADAWDELFDRHYAAAGRFIFQLGYNFSHEDVEEICQEVFLTVIKSIKTFQGQSQFQTWLFRIAANRARDYRQRQNAAKRGGGQMTVPLNTAPSDENPPVDPPSSEPTPDLSMIRLEDSALVGRAMQHLQEPCREIIELRYFADLSYDELAKTMKLNSKTVSSRLSKCLDRLEKILRSTYNREKNSTTSV
jgi:RNA polymerase sigma-70 factor, ECF subfamily